jgi:nitrous oxide reductase accessory protein NosL
MKYRTLFSLALMLAVLLMVAGCFSPSQPVVTPTPTPIPTPVPTTPPTPVPTTMASTIPGPTDTLPPQWPISITVEKSGMYSSTIITHFDGGKGLIYVSRMDVRVTYPDGTVLTDGIMKPRMGDTVEIPGTSGMDRAEVILTMANGQIYTVVDQQMPYKSHG